MPEKQLKMFIEQLRTDGWGTPRNVANPTYWEFDFTGPMKQIIQAGPAAESVLLRYLNHPQINDHIVILLGAIGDEKAIEPIIRIMPTKGESSERAKKLRLVANLALTNITVNDVNRHHGGGIMVNHCPEDPRACWDTWWSKNENSFSVSSAYSRNYSNYPDYGIYENPPI